MKTPRMIGPTEFKAAAGMASIGFHDCLLGSLKGQWREYREDFARCHRKYSEKSVHQFRVQSRRLLSTISVLEAVTPGQALEAARRALKKRLRIFAPLRDTHVQLLAVEELAGDYPELSAFRRALARREGRLTKRVAKKFEHTGLRKVARPVATIRMELCALLQNHEQEERNLHSVMEELGAAYGAVSARLQAIDPADAATIHRTRVAFKKFRYMTEALQPLLPDASDGLIRRMQDYQCRMGDIQDATVLRAGLEKFFRKHKCRSTAATRLLTKLNRRRVALVAAFIKIANTLADFAPPEQRPSGLRTPGAGRLPFK